MTDKHTAIENLSHHIYSYMCTIHGNDRDFEESVCDDLAEMILEDFNIEDKSEAEAALKAAKGV